MSLYRDATALDPDNDRIPARMPHREHTISEITNAIGPLREDRRARPVRISGPSGAGKTTVARFAVRELQKTGFGVHAAYVNAISHSSQTELYHTLLSSIGRATQISYRDPAIALKDKLTETASSQPVVAIVDEASYIDTDASPILRELYDCDDIAVMVIDLNFDHLFASIDDATTDRLRSGPLLELDAYSNSELMDILRARVRAALEGAEDRVTDDGLEFAAEMAEGNARKAITILRSAVDHVHGSPHAVDRDVIAEVGSEAYRRYLQRGLAGLDTEHTVIFEILSDAGELSGPDLHERLESQLGESVGDKQRQRWVSYLRERDLIEKHGKTKGATYAATSLGSAVL